MNRRIAVVVAAATLLLAGCTSADGLAGQPGNGGYISGDGSVLIIPAADRAGSIAYAGDTVEGDRVDSATLSGVVVLNFWYAGCPPCRVESPDLEAVHQEYLDTVTFIGVNTRDSAPTAKSFETTYGVSYDSILDATTRDVLSAFAENVPPAAVPTTLVLDAKGRVAARISGQLPSQTTLADILDAVLAE
ncbi:MAG: TlpA disulfide reductase family protein [Pseudolysinimonas sp.]|uniref:TlpA family protein disulfide reductase n=1 Tax=Pseudolysinimonas sp. TaxID=2680009 RepID=UPI003265378D